ncbi:hypothetical protein [Streptomyces jumonjinensis]|uniref:hypothetical protein n=1 Tax=Streptomyces jumonjinensis TaxID=1945 RepID=UPI0037A4ADCB
MSGHEIVVAEDERSAWVVSVHQDERFRSGYSVARLSLADGARLDQFVPSRPVSLVRCADGTPALTPHGSNGSRSSLPVRRGRRLYFQTMVGTRRERLREEGERWVAAVEVAPSRTRRPAEPGRAGTRRLFPYSPVPGEVCFGGAGVEPADGSLVHAGTVYDGRGLQPGGSFVVRRSLSDGVPDWVFRADRHATALDTAADAVYVAYDNGEIVVLGLGDGAVRGRQHLTVGAVSAVPTALTVAGPGRLVIGTGDGRILLCSVGR